MTDTLPAPTQPQGAQPQGAQPQGAQPPPDEPEVRRDIGGFHQRDLLAVLGAGAAAFSTTMLLYEYIAPFSGKVGFVILAFLAFLGYYALLLSLDSNGPAVRAGLAAVVIHGLAFLVLLALGYVVFFTVKGGLSWRPPDGPTLRSLLHPNFYIQDLRDAGPLDPLDVGGIIHAAVGTLEMITIALILTVPLGLTCAVFLNEIPGRFSRFVRTVVEAMTALPSILAGLFILAVIIALKEVRDDLPKPLRWIAFLELSGFAAALAISVMMLPIIIRAADVVIRLVPGSLREASLALGAGQWRTVWHVVLPTARSGLTTAVILGTARGIGETSPVLLTAGYTANLNWNPFKGPMVSLPLATFELVKSPQHTSIARGFGSAAVLLTLVVILFLTARIIGGRAPGSMSRRQEHRRVLASMRDAERFRKRDEAPSADDFSLPQSRRRSR